MTDPRVPYERDTASRTPSPHAHPPRPPHEGAPGEEGYSATVLASHWIEREDASAASGRAPVPGRPANGVAPDRVEGDVLRFGPGVTVAARRRLPDEDGATRVWHGTVAGGAAARPAPRWRGLVRRYAPAAVILAAVLGFLAWQRYGGVLTVREATVTAGSRDLGCDGTADIVGEVRTDGRPGTVTYRWERSDGTASGLLREKLRKGQERARLHLLWTFHGRGEYRATARLVVVSPGEHTATSGAFTYRCP
ncbi:hypothetical protein [Streptomyces sp. NRRL S-118]|uniref:hypothetical protein n=1 Tax=Streptomyces sp. NRRL S-118 TaxID=1463881 RepID=UPI0004C945F9|nr:hypothetical protein [Streptomyces sp. NRRL S-118]